MKRGLVAVWPALFFFFVKTFPPKIEKNYKQYTY